uniref:C3/C5 convertase n=1 Tax=Exaiptasia diaphana TaxID=2652724 RepID=A0A182C8W2_EXADI|nr:factor B1 protein [Exaiptasia diaphana]
MSFLSLVLCLVAVALHSSNPVTGSCSTRRAACFNGGTCVDVKPNGFKCVCKQGFTGQNCKKSVNPTAIKKCPRLTIKNGSVRLIKSPGGLRASFSCDQGYKINGATLKICTRGVWYNRQKLTCRPKKNIQKRCTGFSTRLYRGSVRVKKQTRYLAELVYRCRSGYSLIGDAIRKCNNGQWNSVLKPYCIKAKKCKKLRKPRNGKIFGGTFPGSLVRFFCDNGYEIKGFNQSKCLLKTGKWDNPVPKCEKIDPLRDLRKAANSLRRHFINKYELLTTDSRARAGLSSGAAGLDLVFVFDSSASVGQDNFKKGIEFARTIISEFGVSNSTSGTRVAVVVFSSTAEVIYNLQTKKIVDQKAAINTLKNLKLRGKGTATKLALDTVIKEVVPERRNNSKKALFLITDGESNTGRDPARPAKVLRGVYDFEIYAIGVTLRRVNVGELRDIASEPFRTHVYLLKDFQSLETLKDLITKPKGSNFSDCGIAGDTRLRERSDQGVLAGRQDSEQGAWPWMAAIYVRDKYRCTGVLLAEGWVLAVAHCFENDVNVKGPDVLVVLGEHDRTFIEGSEQYIRVEKIRKHKRYPKAKPDYDLVLLKLQNKAKLSTYVRTICLPRMSDRIVIRPNGVGVIAGWGSAQNANGRPAFKILAQTRANFISRQACQRQVPHAISNKMICAVNRQVTKIDCSGDFGSPIVVHRSHRQDWALAGFAIKGGGCVYKGKTGVFSNLLTSQYIRWIERRVTT